MFFRLWKGEFNEFKLGFVDEVLCWYYNYEIKSIGENLGDLDGFTF